MKKVLVVITTAFVKVGGLTSVMMNYYRALDKTELQIDFASTNIIEKDLETEITNHNSKYYQLPPRSSIFKYMVSLSKIGKEYDILHVHGNSATASIELLSGKIARIPNRIIHIHTSHTDYPKLQIILKPIFHNLYTDALACSDVAGSWAFGKRNFTILKNAIDTKKYSFNKSVREKYRKLLGLETEFVFGHIGKMMNAKNHIFLVQIFKELLEYNKNFKLLFIGDGEMRMKIENEVLRNNLTNNVVFLGMRQDIPQLLQAMDAFIFPSLWEGLPLSVLEAQASGLPCFISSSVTSEVNVSGYTKYLSLSLSAKEWASYIIDNLTTTDRAEASENSCSVIKDKKYEISSVAQDLYALYVKDKNNKI